MARKPDMTIDQLVRKLEHANSVHVKSIKAATPLLLGLNAGESFAKKLSAQIGGGTVTITHDSSTSTYHVSQVIGPQLTRLQSLLAKSKRM